MRIYKSAFFERFARKQNIDDKAVKEAIRRAERGLIDADLGGGVIKQRVARPGQGKSGGYRVIILDRQGHRSFLVYGFAKSDKANIDTDELAAYRLSAQQILNLTEEHLSELIRLGEFLEVEEDDDEELS